MRDLAVPGQTIDVVRSSCCISQTEGVLDVANVVDEELTLGARGSQNLGFQGVELKSLDGASMFCRPGDGRIGSPSLEFLGVPKFESAILKSTRNDTLRMVGVGRSPSNIVKSNNFSCLAKAKESNTKILP